ncbi:MAG: gamma-glutamyltransferase [Balneolales bacterium]|nr:gamma-glutamyltransferase [Balneolales bacterium]
MFKIVSCTALIILSVSMAAHAQFDRLNNHFITRSEVIAANGMVATSHPLAAQVGLDILKQGGNAIDAAIATNAAMGLMEPTGNGIGGDLYAILWHAETGQLYALNASGRSPLGLSYEQLMADLSEMDEDRIPPSSLLSVSVPGAIDGWFELHERFGKLPMSDLMAPSVMYAEQGFPVPEVIADAWRRSARFLADRPGAFIETFTIDGRGPEKGEIMVNPDLGNTYRLLGEHGRDVFYRGDITRKIDAYMREHGGYLRFEDFDQHRSEWIETVHSTYRGYEMHQIGQNNQGTAVIQMLNILEGFDLASKGFNSPEALHVMIEAKKLAFEDRAKYYSDPDFNELPFERMLSKEYAAERRSLIGDRALERVTSGIDGLRDGGTIYLTTADRDGNMVSLIQSNFRGMGTGFVVPGTGFSFQNRGELFSLDPAHPNVYEPGKRPFHTIIPGFVLKDGKPWFTLGVMGGEFQPMGHVQILVNMIDFGMNVQEASDAIRWLHTNSTEPTESFGDYLKDGGLVRFESDIDPEIVEKLREMGHQVEIGGGFYGRFQGILFDHEKGVFIGGSEARADGQAVGY